eukprot:Rmarinus@m.2393
MCVNGHNNLTPEEFSDILITTLGEPPGLLFTAIIINVIGRRRTLAVNLTLAGACIALLLPCVSRDFETAIIRLAFECSLQDRSRLRTYTLSRCTQLLSGPLG